MREIIAISSRALLMGRTSPTLLILPQSQPAPRLQLHMRINSTVQYSTVQYRTIQYSTVQYREYEYEYYTVSHQRTAFTKIRVTLNPAEKEAINTFDNASCLRASFSLQYSEVKESTVRYKNNAIQHSAVQESTVQCNAV